MAKVIRATADYGPKQARQQVGDRYVFEERSAKEGKALRGRIMAPCEYLSRKGFITTEQQTAGERLTQSWYDAGLIKATTINLFGIRGGPRDYTPKQLAARDDFNRAMRALGPGLAEVAYHICVLEASVGEWESLQGWRKGTGMPLVKTAFRQLAVHYGLEN